ncbi:MAG: hypothetical protein FWD15_03075 [Alphaproteobacteria bacterium]|nr:hypothetical protein [Alphaproteobacteria bacterium]
MGNILRHLYITGKNFTLDALDARVIGAIHKLRTEGRFEKFDTEISEILKLAEAHLDNEEFNEMLHSMLSKILVAASGEHRARMIKLFERMRGMRKIRFPLKVLFDARAKVVALNIIKEIADDPCFDMTLYDVDSKDFHPALYDIYIAERGATQGFDFYAPKLLIDDINASGKHVSDAIIDAIFEEF